MMKRELATEAVWIIVNLLLALVIAFLIFGKRLFDGIAADIQLHDTYFVFPKEHITIIIFMALLTISYLARAIYYKLNNRLINFLLMPLLIIVLLVLVLQLNSVHGLEYHLRVVYSTETDIEVKAEALSGFTLSKGVLWTLIVVIVTVLGLTGYKILKPNRV